MRKAILTLGAVACAVPALALAAADPKPDSHFAYCQTTNRCSVAFNTNNAGTKIKNLTMYGKCSQVPVGGKGFFPPVAVNNGRFSKEGTVENVLGEKVNWEFQGRFKRPKKAVGEYKLTTKDCNDSAHDFVAKRDGPAA